MESRKRWRNLLLFCLGLTIGTAFIMGWLEGDFWVNDERFSILGLELFYSKREVLTVLNQIKQPARIALTYHLTFDYILMAGFYPGIASFCMLVREKVSRKPYQTTLFALAILQPVACIFDIVVNSYLLKWVEQPAIGDEFSVYHNMVFIKWLIALAGILIASAALLIGNKGPKKSRGA